jgi:glycosyltransferase involved in cell wall biosynthesis
MIDLIFLGDRSIEWTLGAIHVVAPEPAAIADWWERQSADGVSAPFCLFWDPSLGMPDAKLVQSLTQQKCDVHHAGLRMGMGGQPVLLDSVAPLWMFHRDPAPDIPATSWRMSLRCALVRTEVIRTLGFIHPSYSTLEGASLEAGHRWLLNGALMRHQPQLLPASARPVSAPLPMEDGARFLLHRYGAFWTQWALARGALRGVLSLREAKRVWNIVRRETKPAEPPAFRHSPESTEMPQSAPVSVLIPTVDRYPYLRVLLDQLRRQTVAPLEIIVVDQTPPEERQFQLESEFADLPIRVLYQDQPGQCTSRNAGLLQCNGDYILLLDDDIEAPPDLIEAHLRTICQFVADASCGVAEEVGAEPLPAGMKMLRASDVFPAGNTLLSRNTLERVGLFDLAYDRGARADGDLGMRVYLGGALTILNPEISVLHHRAPSGGLRTHRARVVTYSSSRNRLTHRQLLTATEAYMALRYFNKQQLKERLWLNVLGTFSIRGSKGRKLLKAMIALCLLPHTLWVLRQRCRQAEQMMQEYPQIPTLECQRDLFGTE